MILDGFSLDPPGGVDLVLRQLHGNMHPLAGVSPDPGERLDDADLDLILERPPVPSAKKLTRAPR